MIHRRRGRTDGSVLVAALFLLGVLALVAASLHAIARQESRLTALRWERVQRIQLAKRLAVELGGWAAKSPGVHTTLRDLADGSAALGHGAVVTDETARINLNTADAETLERLLGPEGKAALLDWRDKDDSTGTGGAENSFYGGLPVPYRCRNGRLENVAELLLVKGVSAAAYHRAEPVVTAWGPGKINVNTVSRDTLTLLGLPENVVEKTMVLRAGPDRTMGTSDDRVWERPGDWVEALSLTTAEAAALKKYETLWGVRSSLFRLDLPRGASFGPALSLVVDCAKSGKTDLLSWREED